MAALTLHRPTAAALEWMAYKPRPTSKREDGRSTQTKAMKIIYQISTQTIKARINGEYLVNGQPGVLDDDHVILDLVDDPAPEYDATTHRIESERVADLHAKTYGRKWTVIPLTPEELQGRAQQNAIEQIIATADAAFGQMTPGKRALWRPTRDAIEAAIRDMDFQLAQEILLTMPVLYPEAADERDAFLQLLTPPS